MKILGSLFSASIMTLILASSAYADRQDSWVEKDGWSWKNGSNNEDFAIGQVKNNLSAEYPVVLGYIIDGAYMVDIDLELEFQDGSETTKRIKNGNGNVSMLVRLTVQPEGKNLRKARLVYHVNLGEGGKRCTSVTPKEGYSAWRFSKSYGTVTAGNGCHTLDKGEKEVDAWEFPPLILTTTQSALSVTSDYIWALDQDDDVNKISRRTGYLVEHTNANIKDISAGQDGTPYVINKEFTLKLQHNGKWKEFDEVLPIDSFFGELLFQQVTGVGIVERQYLLTTTGEAYRLNMENIEPLGGGAEHVGIDHEMSPNPTLSLIDYSEIAGESLIGIEEGSDEIFKFDSEVNLWKGIDVFYGVDGFSDIAQLETGNYVGIKGGEMYVLKPSSGSVTKRNREIWMHDSPFTDIAVSPDGVVYTMDETYTIWEYTGNSTWDYVRRLN